MWSITCFAKRQAFHQQKLWTFEWILKFREDQSSRIHTRSTWILKFREEQSSRIHTRSTRNRHRDEGYTTLEMEKSPHQRHASAAICRQLGLGIGSCKPHSS
jgi:hypothetical protein